MLFMLPPDVRWLELAVPRCAGPLLPALASFRHLQELTISGNAADVSWDVGPAAALAPLRTLCLDYRRHIDDYPEFESYVEMLPPSTQRALCAATTLHSLELRVSWGDEVAQLCLALPGLRDLK